MYGAGLRSGLLMLSEHVDTGIKQEERGREKERLREDLPSRHEA